MFSDIRIYFSGAIFQSQSLIGRTKFPARAAAFLRSKASSALAGSDTSVNRPCFLHRSFYKHIKKRDISFRQSVSFLFLLHTPHHSKFPSTLANLIILII